MPDSIIVALVTGSAGAAVVKLLDNVIQWNLARRAKQKDGEAIVETEQDKKINGLQAGLRVVLLDRIQYLCQCYIQDKSITFDDRRRLHMMHDVYHNALEGNGDLDAAMRQIDLLPLKAR